MKPGRRERAQGPRPERMPGVLPPGVYDMEAQVAKSNWFVFRVHIVNETARPPYSSSHTTRR